MQQQRKLKKNKLSNKCWLLILLSRWCFFFFKRSDLYDKKRLTTYSLISNVTTKQHLPHQNVGISKVWQKGKQILRRFQLSPYISMQFGRKQNIRIFNRSNEYKTFWRITHDGRTSWNKARRDMVDFVWWRMEW